MVPGFANLQLEHPRRALGKRGLWHWWIANLLSLAKWILQKRGLMVGFKNRYMIMEVFLDPNRDLMEEDPILLTQFNVSKAIKYSIFVNFGECGLASSLGSLRVKYVNPVTKLCIIRASREDYQKVWSAISMVRSISNCPVLFNLLDLSGSIKACKTMALKCEEMKFEQYKLMVGARLSADVTQQMQNYIEKMKILEH